MVLIILLVLPVLLSPAFLSGNCVRVSALLKPFTYFVYFGFKKSSHPAKYAVGQLRMRQRHFIFHLSSFITFFALRGL